MPKLRSRFAISPSMVVACLALAVALGGVAIAAIPEGDGTVRTCYQKQKGNLRVVSSDGECLASERALNLAGPLDVQVVNATTGASLGAKSVVATCPQNKRVIGTAYNIDFAGGTVLMDEVVILPGGKSVRAIAFPRPEGASQPWTLTATAVCARTS